MPPVAEVILTTRLKDLGQRLLEGFTDLVFPPLCHLCDRQVDVAFAEAMYCTACRHEVITPVEGSCFRCAARMPYRIDGDKRVPIAQRRFTLPGCPDCRKRKWTFDRTVAVGAYEGRWRDHVYQLKRAYHSADAFQAGKLLANQLAQCQWLEDCDQLVPLPIHWRRHLSRGFNQAHQIALGIQDRLNLPILGNVLCSQRYTQKQGTLTAAQRITNVQKSLSLTRHQGQLSGKSVIIVDDVMTTGATVNQAAILCRKAGAKRIAVAVVARAGRN